MNYIRPTMNSLQVSEIGDVLEKLFTFQDKPLSENKKAVLAQEIINYGFPYQAIIAGIKDLFMSDLRTLKLVNLIDSIRKCIDYDAGRADCPYCKKEGAICAIDAQSGAPYAIACKCSNGDAVFEKQQLVRWNGQNKQLSNGRNLIIGVVAK